MFRRRDPIQEAVALATLTTAFNAHQVKCTEDKAEIKRQLAEQDAERRRMHAENSTKFDKIYRIIWIATGAMAALQFLARNGLDAVISKVLHP